MWMPFFQNDHSSPFHLIIYLFSISEHRCMIYFIQASLMFYFIYLSLSHTRRTKKKWISYLNVKILGNCMDISVICIIMHCGWHQLMFMDQVCQYWAIILIFSLLYITVSSTSCRTTRIFFHPCSMPVMSSWKHVEIPKLPHFNWNCLVGGWGVCVSSSKRSIVWSSKCENLHQSWSAAYNNW